MATKADVAKILMVLFEAYNNMPEPSTKPKEVDGVKYPSTVDVWHEILGDLDYPALSAAAKQYISEPHAFAPSAGQLRESAMKLLIPDSPPALEGWKVCLDATERFGADQFERAMAYIAERNPVAEQAMRQLGWYDWCMSDTDHQMSWRKQFVDCYNAYAQRQREELAQLPAVAEFKQLAAARRAQEITSGVTKKLAAPGGAKR